eukprot:TRINITY_DN25231_c0_g1_i1.p1 TRINITY_DN25231_c0_g1~~TRINITY_DN25231_c0_g1_i1.p1  ORF type:complete len:793 (-),score=172.36 TRINITY_DN25231_c0_g1_i1:97-2475(-)
MVAAGGPALHQAIAASVLGERSPVLPGMAEGVADESLHGDLLPFQTVAMKYEQLLIIQQQQQARALQQKDAELAHVQACLDVLEGRNNDPTFAQVLQTKEEESALMMAAKHKELELMVGLLQLREQQIEELRSKCEEQQFELGQLRNMQSVLERLPPPGSLSPTGQQLGSFPVGRAEQCGSPPDSGMPAIAASPASGMAGVAGSPCSVMTGSSAPARDDSSQMRKEVRRLRLRMEDLEACVGEQQERSAVLARELQAKSDRVEALEEHLQSLQASPGGVSATPNGYVRPVVSSLFQDAEDSHAIAHWGGSQDGGASVVPSSRRRAEGGADLRAGGAHCGGGLQQQPLGRVASCGSLRGGSHGLPQHHHEPQGATSGACAAGFSPVPSQRSSPRPGHRHEPLALRRLGGSGGSSHRPDAEVSASQHLLNAPAQPSTISDMADSVTSQLPTYRSAVRADGADNTDAPIRQAGMASEPLSRPVRHRPGSARMGQEAQEPEEASRQSQELLREMRRLRLQMSELEQVAAGQRTDPATSGISIRAGNGPQLRSADRLEGSLSSLGSISSRYGCNADGLHREEAERDAADRALHEERSHRRESTFCPYCGNIFMADANFCRKCGRKLEEPDISRTMPLGNESAGQRSEPVTSGAGRADMADSLRPGALLSGSVSTRALAAPPRPQSVTSFRSEDQSEYAGWEYRPHASDPIDESVAILVNRPGGRYRGWRALLCRLERGVYLCGTRRVQIRADDMAELIEASEDGGVSWSDLADLMNGAEASQHALLERAKGAIGMFT